MSIPLAGVEDMIPLAVVCLRLGVAQSTLYQAMREGRLVATKIGANWYVREQDCRMAPAAAPTTCRYCGAVFIPKVKTKRPRVTCYQDRCLTMAERKKGQWRREK
jgi:hypothetical protein